MILRLRVTCGSELDPQSYGDSDRVVVNRAEPWIQNYYLGELCPQDIKDAKLPPTPPGAIEAREFFRKNWSVRENFVPQRSE